VSTLRTRGQKELYSHTAAVEKATTWDALDLDNIVVESGPILSCRRQLKRVLICPFTVGRDTKPLSVQLHARPPGGGNKTFRLQIRKDGCADTIVDEPLAGLKRQVSAMVYTQKLDPSSCVGIPIKVEEIVAWLRENAVVLSAVDPSGAGQRERWKGDAIRAHSSFLSDYFGGLFVLAALSVLRALRDAEKLTPHAAFGSLFSERKLRGEIRGGFFPRARREEAANSADAGAHVRVRKRRRRRRSCDGLSNRHRGAALRHDDAILINLLLKRVAKSTRATRTCKRCRRRSHARSERR
jgi:hypothetical protein